MPPPPEVWAGVECAHVGVGDRMVDQLALTGHAERDGDIALLASLGAAAARYPVLWGRGASGAAGDETDWAWADRRLDALRRHAIRPVLGLLHHGQGPLPGGLLDPGFVDGFAAFAGAVARRYPWAHDWLPINEPLTTARFAGMYGLWAPHEHSWASGVRMLVAQCLAIRAAIRAVREVIPAARLLVNEDCGETYGTPACRSAIEFGNERRWLTFDLLCGRVDRQHPLWGGVALDAGLVAHLEDLAADPEPPDLLGVDYYVTSDRWLDDRLELYPEWSHGGDGRIRFADVELVRVGEAAYEPFHRAIRETWERYRRPIALAEVQLAADPRDQVAWWDAAWAAAVDALEAGIDVRAVTAWSAFGAWEWNSLLCRVDGCYEAGSFDARSGVPRLTPVGRRVAATARGEAPTKAGGGWWSRSSRVLWPAVPTPAAPAGTRPGATTAGRGALGPSPVVPPAPVPTARREATAAHGAAPVDRGRSRGGRTVRSRAESTAQRPESTRERG